MQQVCSFRKRKTRKWIILIILQIENHAHFDVGSFTGNLNLLLFVHSTLTVSDFSPDKCNLKQDVNLPVMHWEKRNAFLFSYCFQSSNFMVETGPKRMAYLSLSPLALFADMLISIECFYLL